RNVSILIDSGAEGNFMSDRLKTYFKNYLTPAPPLQLTFANGTIYVSDLQASKVPISVQDYKAHISFRLAALPHLDLIVGRPWLQSVNPRIDWKKNTIMFPKKSARNIDAVMLVMKTALQKKGSRKRHGKDTESLIF